MRLFVVSGLVFGWKEVSSFFGVGSTGEGFRVVRVGFVGCGEVRLVLGMVM